MKKTALWLLLLIMVCGNMFYGVTAAEAAEKPVILTESGLKTAVDQVMAEQLETLQIPGAAVVVTQGEDILFSKGYGYADVERKLPMDPAATHVRIGSITKSLTAVAVLQLVEQGQLSLNKDINTYLSSFKVPLYSDKPITLHGLLTHTAGLDQTSYNLVSLSKNDSTSAGEFLREYFHNQPPVREPGVQFDYNNINLGLTGHLVEQVSGQTLGDYMQEHLFKPLDMPSASLSVAQDDPNLPKSYSSDGQGGYALLPYEYFNIPGAGAMSVIPNEFAHYLIAQLNHGRYKDQTILAPGSLANMQAEQYAAHPLLNSIGYSLFRGELANGTPTLSHTGAVEGFSSDMVLIPSQQLGIYIVANSADSDLSLHEKVVQAIGRLLPGKASLPTPPLAVSAETLGQYEGTYTYRLSPQHGIGKWIRLFEGSRFEVKAAGEQLEINGRFDQGTEGRMFIPVGDGIFQEQDGSLKVWFHQQDGGWKLTGISDATLDRTTFWHKPSTLLILYAGFGLLWLGLLLIWLVRYTLRRFSTRKKPISGHIAVISAIFAVYLPVQTLYGLINMSFGFPAWYRYGIGSLPLLAALCALHLLKVNGTQAAQGNPAAIGKSGIAILCLGFTIYLGYWNMLSILFS